MINTKNRTNYFLWIWNFKYQEQIIKGQFPVVKILKVHQKTMIQQQSIDGEVQSVEEHCKTLCKKFNSLFWRFLISCCALFSISLNFFCSLINVSMVVRIVSFVDKHLLFYSLWFISDLSCSVSHYSFSCFIHQYLCY